MEASTAVRVRWSTRFAGREAQPNLADVRAKARPHPSANSRRSEPRTTLGLADLAPPPPRRRCQRHPTGACRARCGHQPLRRRQVREGLRDDGFTTVNARQPTGVCFCTSGAGHGGHDTATKRRVDVAREEMRWRPCRTPTAGTTRRYCQAGGRMPTIAMVETDADSQGGPSPLAATVRTCSE